MILSTFTKFEVDYVREYCDFTEYESLMFEGKVNNIRLKDIKNKIINDLENKGEYYSDFVLDYYLNNIYIIMLDKVKRAIKEYERGDEK